MIVDWWQPQGGLPLAKMFTTVTSWKHTWNDVIWQGETWKWSKHYEFRKLQSLPQHCNVPLELAVSGIGDDEAEQFRSSGWHLRLASELSDPDKYREYIRSSLGEFTVAKEQNVRARTGWFSDRSVCYLAAGRPVVTQETGFSKFLPCGAGLLPFLIEAEAVEALEAITGNYERHSAAALEIAREYFEADDVLRRLLATIGLL